jgi:uncharacterized linocin/CFP29 family protein
MADSNLQLQWTDDQWNRVRQVVYEEARRARVGGNFLPLYGPLEPDATYVSKQELYGPTGSAAGFTVADRDTLKLITVQERVYLRGAQVADPELSSALIAFRRAANVLARREDKIIFNGQSAADDEPGSPTSTATRGPAGHGAGGGDMLPGLVAKAKTRIPVPPTRGFGQGDALVTAVSEAIGELEGKYHLGPFACVLGQEYFKAVQTPDGTAVLPQDRILPFLGGGALLRTSVLKPQQGLVIALGGAPIDLVVATDVSVSFLQVTPDPWFVFRVYEKIVLRIKQPEAIAILEPDDEDGGHGDSEDADDDADTDEEGHGKEVHDDDTDAGYIGRRGAGGIGRPGSPVLKRIGDDNSVRGIDFGEHLAQGRHSTSDR